MRIERADEGGVNVLVLEGVIRLGESAEQFSSSLRRLLDDETGPVLLDLVGIDHVDSTGLGELVGYLQRFSSVGRRLALLDPHPRVRALLRLTSLDEVFPIFEDREAALSSMGGSSTPGKELP